MLTSTRAIIGVVSDFTSDAVTAIKKTITTSTPNNSPVKPGETPVAPANVGTGTMSGLNHFKKAAPEEKKKPSCARNLFGEQPTPPGSPVNKGL